MVQMAFCDLSHTLRFDKRVSNVSQHVFVILLWGILTFPLSISTPDATNILHFSFFNLNCKKGRVLGCRALAILQYAVVHYPKAMSKAYIPPECVGALGANTNMLVSKIFACPTPVKINPTRVLMRAGGI